MRVLRALRLSLVSLLEDAPETWTADEVVPGWGRLSSEEQHHVRALIASIAASRGQRPALRAAEERAPYVGDNAAAIEEARRESERLSESEERDQEDGGDQRQRRRGQGR